MRKVINFEHLAEIAIKREVQDILNDDGDFALSISMFRTEVVDKGFGRNVTVWLETECSYPQFWDVMPVQIVYKGQELSLGDICERAGRFLKISIDRLHRKYYRQMVEGLSDL